MARPNDSEQTSQEPIEYLKRRFIRQNRDLARINATQAIQVRTLELEISRLLAENVELREKAIHDDVEIRKLRRIIEPATADEQNSAEEDKTPFVHERRELGQAILSPISEKDERSPVRLRSPITITRITSRRPAKGRIPRTKDNLQIYTQSQSEALRLASLRDDVISQSPKSSTSSPYASPLEADRTVLESPARPSPIILSPLKRTSPSPQQSPTHRSPARRLSIYHSPTPQLSPSPVRDPPVYSSMDPSKSDSPVAFSTSPVLAYSIQRRRERDRERPALAAKTTNLSSPSKENGQNKTEEKDRPRQPKKVIPMDVFSPPASATVIDLDTDTTQNKASFEDSDGSSSIDTPVPSTQSRGGRRRSAVVSYTEPSLRKKMRRQSATLVDAAAAGSMIRAEGRKL